MGISHQQVGLIQVQDNTSPHDGTNMYWGGGRWSGRKHGFLSDLLLPTAAQKDSVKNICKESIRHLN